MVWKEAAMLTVPARDEDGRELDVYELGGGASVRFPRYASPGQIVAAVAAAERERCAKIADAWVVGGYETYEELEHIAAAIRRLP
jgi:hypothetical protein